MFTASGLWELPVRFSNKFANTVIGGWNLTGIATLQSGNTFTVGSGVDNSRTGVGQDRADIVGNPYFSGDRSRDEIVAQYLNKRRSLRMRSEHLAIRGAIDSADPGFANFDFGLHKNFRITERVNTQFRFETFNTFNRVNLNSPTTAQNSRQLHAHHQHPG